MVGDRDSTIKIDKRSNFKIPEGCTIHPNPENGVYHGKYIIRREYNEVVAVYNFENGKREGECRLYDRGSLKERVNYANDIVVGWNIEIEKYKEVKWFVYENNEKKVECRESNDLDGYWDFIDIESGLRVKSCKVNDNKKECGVGYVFEEGRITRVVEFVNGEEVRVIKEFDEEGKMREYDENGQLVYVGDYCGNMKEGLCREGKEGIEIREGESVYIGEWKNGKRDGYGKSLVDGFAEYEGEWKENLPDGEGVFVENDEIKYEGKWERGVFKTKEYKLFNYETKELVGITIEITSNDQLDNLIRESEEKKLEVKELVVKERCCNDMTGDLEISGFNNLEKIVLKKGCLQNLNSLKICGNENLRFIEVESEQGQGDCYITCRYVKNVIIESIG